MEFEVLASGYGLVEGPTEDAAGGIVFSDVLGGGVYRVAASRAQRAEGERRPEGAGAVTTLVPKRRGVGGIALHADGGIVCSGRDIVHVRENVTRTLFSIPGLPGWNDLCTDAAGRVYAGALRFAVFDRSAQPVPGECYRIEREGEAQLVYGGVLHANGIALSPNGRTIYHSDTRAGVIFVHDLDRAGNATARRTWAMTGGQPDGLAVDVEGGVWVASAGGGRIDRYRPDGRVERSLAVPARIVTSVCFAGPDRCDLIVTTADHADEPDLRGCVLRTRVDVAGAPVFQARL
jgi:sugar lactone lactonase YvrE